MIIVIDGYNVLKSVYSGDVSEKERDWFIADLNAYAAKRGHKIILVFDGGLYDRPDKERIGKVYVVYSGVTESADDYIKEYIERNKQYDLLLISSDRDIALWASNYEIPSLDSIIFYRILKETMRKKASKGKGGKKELVKLHPRNDPEVDAIMEEGSRVIEHKTEDLIPDRISKQKKLSKKERALMKKLKKL